MKTHNNIIRFLLITTLAMAAPLLLHAQLFSEKREQSKSFKLKPGITILISNKYGNINIMPWEKDSVRFELSISAQSKQAAKVVKILSTIDCEMISTASTISARTVFYDNSATFWKDVVSYAGQVINTSNNLQINYTVYVPVTVPLKIDNKFGNVYIDSHRANVEINLSNGDLQARDFSGILKLKLEFGSASMQDIDDAQLTINYSDLECGKINTLNLNSRSSTIEIQSAGTTELISSRDKLNVKSCNTLSGEASFSRIRISELEALCSMNTKYGELKLNNISRNFSTIQVKSEYTDVYLGINPSAGYGMDLLYDSKTSLNISPLINNQLKKEMLNTKLGTTQATGEVGKSGSSHISVTTKAGALSMLNK